MKQEDLKFVKGSVERGKPATICFFSEVEKWNVQDFIWEFNWIKDRQPSEIKVLINSVGGNCVDGISAFSTIINCEIPVTCIIEGIAASMASIIWAAGNKCLMRDYALLMIHNPWSEKSDDPETQRTIENFTTQLKTIYTKRFKMDEEKITAIMNGEDNYDGTFFTAQQAVEAGFITADQIIETGSVSASIAAKLEGVSNSSAIVSIMQGAIDQNLKSIESRTIMKKEDNLLNNKTNNMNQEFLTVAALLGLTGEKANESAVSAKIQDLVKASKELETLKAEKKALDEKVSALNTELAGSKASVENLTKNLNDAQAALDKYKQAEEAARKASINAMIDDAITAGKIGKDAKDTWVAMAEENFDLAKQTLDSIPVREDISAQIAQDPTNKQKTAEQMADEEAKVKAQVDEVVGKDFAFRSLK